MTHSEPMKSGNSECLEMVIGDDANTSTPDGICQSDPMLQFCAASAVPAICFICSQMLRLLEHLVQ